MKKDPQYLYALDAHGNLVYIDNAIKDKNVKYYCPHCNAQMTLRKGKIKQPHFAHKSENVNCTYESYLHKLAKKLILQCFNESSYFKFNLNQTVICSVNECPLGKLQKCSWYNPVTFNLKDYYEICKEEAIIGPYRADLILKPRNHKDEDSLLIEILVTHKSTDKKIESGYRIIEIPVASESDITKITSTNCISARINDGNQSSSVYKTFVTYFNSRLKPSFEVPGPEHQQERFRFWIEQNGNFKFENWHQKVGEIQDLLEWEKNLCLSPNPEIIEKALFRIDSPYYISWDLAFKELALSNINLRYCPMCEYQKEDMNGSGYICILYKKFGTPKYPYCGRAKSCQYFKQKLYNNPPLISNPIQEEYKVFIQQI